MAMVRFYLMFTLRILIQMFPLKWILQQLAMGKFDSILIYMRAEKYVWVYWEHGEEVHPRTGIQKYQHYYKYSFQFKQSLWVKKFTSMNLALNMNKVQRKDKRKMRHIQILLGMLILNLQCFKT